VTDSGMIHGLFNHRGLRRLLLNIRVPLVLLLLLAWPWWAKPQLFWCGVGISAMGEVLQLWCFACIEKEKVLTIRGPYQLCRNPMYLGRYLLILGFIAVTGSVVAMGIYTLVYYYYMVNRVKREEPVLEGIFGEPYRDYCRDVHRFMPGRGRFERGSFSFFNWQIMLTNNGLWNLLAAVVAYVYLMTMLQWVVT